MLGVICVMLGTGTLLVSVLFLSCIDPIQKNKKNFVESTVHKDV